MSHYITQNCLLHGEWDMDVDNVSEQCPACWEARDKEMNRFVDARDVEIFDLGLKLKARDKEIARLENALLLCQGELNLALDFKAERDELKAEIARLKAGDAK